ncbi:MAG: hypothetical protein U1E17_13440 [Geminicoccaceae bacterium]
MLTALAEATDKVIGLELGADDHVAKPFDLREPWRASAVLRGRAARVRHCAARDGGAVPRLRLPSAAPALRSPSACASP